MTLLLVLIELRSFSFSCNGRIVALNRFLQTLMCPCCYFLNLMRIYQIRVFMFLKRSECIDCNNVDDMDKWIKSFIVIFGAHRREKCNAATHLEHDF